MKASLAGSVLDGMFYKELKNFNPQDIHQHVGLYIFRGISPSPKL